MRKSSVKITLKREVGLGSMLSTYRIAKIAGAVIVKTEDKDAPKKPTFVQHRAGDVIAEDTAELLSDAYEVTTLSPTEK